MLIQRYDQSGLRTENSSNNLLYSCGEDLTEGCHVKWTWKDKEEYMEWQRYDVEGNGKMQPSSFYVITLPNK